MKTKLLATFLMGIISLGAMGYCGKTIVSDAFPLPIDVMSRADIDENGFLEGVDLDFAAAVYEEPIIQLANLNEDTKRYAKAIFFFILENRRIPTASETLRAYYTSSLRRSIRVDYAMLKDFYNIAYLNL